MTWFSAVNLLDDEFLTGRRPVRNYSPGALATIALWKSAPMIRPNGLLFRDLA